MSDDVVKPGKIFFAGSVAKISGNRFDWHCPCRAEGGGVMDIVERLRVRAKIETAAGVREIEDNIDWIAADEIERLRKVLQEIADKDGWCSAKAVAKRLREAGYVDINTIYKMAEEAADEIERLREALKASVATIGALYEHLERVEKAGGATSLEGVAACHIMLKSMRKNANRVEELVMKPARDALKEGE